MILLNFLFVAFVIVLHIVQLGLFGRLRTSEVEQLYDKSWYAVTETLLAMSIFRDDFDVKFLLLFGALLGAKCFHWICASRVDFMEQGVAANTRLFHARMVACFLLLFSVDAFMVYSSIQSVLAFVAMGRPNIMVMFAFEFAILFINCLSICGRYGLGLAERYVMARDKERRKREREAERERIRQEGGEVEPDIDDELDEDEWELGGWEDRAKWNFGFDLTTGT